MVKIRLQRRGRKRYAFYLIVVVDSRKPRDGEYIEKLGYYDPNPEPPIIELDIDRALLWLQRGAQPTDTCRSLLSRQGVFYKKHLLEGIKKGAFDEKTAEKKFQEWWTERQQKIKEKREKILQTQKQKFETRKQEEIKIKEERAKKILEKIEKQTKEQVRAQEQA